MPHLIPSIYNVSDFYDITIEEIVKKISKDYLKTILAIRNQKSEAERKRMKVNLPAFTLGNFVNRIDNNGFISTKYLIYDVDGLDKDAVIRAKHIVDRFCLFSFVSPSGKGIKFIIELAHEVDKITYSGNYQYYLNFFTDLTKLKLDRAYHAKHTFISHDADCKLNPKNRVFDVMSVEDERKVTDVDVDTIDKDEIDEVCTFIANSGPLNYHEWVMVALALKSMTFLGPKAKELFLKIGDKDVGPDHSHRRWDDKFESVGTPTSITAGSLFWIAIQRGYERKSVYTKDGKGQKCPFTVKADGMYLHDNKGYPRRVFGFKDIKVLYTVIDEVNGNKIILRVDGEEIAVPQKAMASTPAFRDVILRTKPGLTYLTISEGKPYDALFNYLDRTQSRLMVKASPGIGQVEHGVWNLGNAVLMDGSILPWEQIIHTKDSRGYMLDDVSSEITINAVKEFYPKLERMFEFYGNWAAIAIGWAFSNIYYGQILSKCGGFPVLFVHGQTKSGKSQLAHLILSMFGVKNPENSSSFKLSMDKATSRAMSRIKDRAFGIPTLFDEYGSSSNPRKREEHYLTLKSLFDGSGMTMARFTNDNQTWKMNVRSGSMFTACNKETQEEAVNRCVYICMDGVARGKDSKVFESLYLGEGRRDLAAFLPLMVLRSDYGEWQRLYDEHYQQIRHIPVGSRVHANYAITMAGYSMARKVVSKHCKLPDVATEFWINAVKSTEEFMADSDPAQIFFHHLSTMAFEENKYPWLRVEDMGVGNEATILVFHLQSALIEMKNKYRQIADILPSEKELRQRILEHPAYRGGRQLRIAVIGSKYCYSMEIAPDENPLSLTTIEPKAEQEPVPF